MLAPSMVKNVYTGVISVQFSQLEMKQILMERSQGGLKTRSYIAEFWLCESFHLILLKKLGFTLAFSFAL